MQKPIDPDHDVAEFIRERLAQPGQSLADVARATGISRRWLDMMRAGEISKPGLPHLERLAAHYGYRLAVRPAGDPVSVGG